MMCTLSLTGEAITRSDFALVELEDMSLSYLYSTDHRHLVDSKHIKSREGTLVLDVGRQFTSLGWSTKDDGQVYCPSKFKHQLIYFGKPLRAGAALTVNLVESDEGVRSGLGKLG